MHLELIQGDITHQQVDAIVNAANSSLFGGGGVDGAIHKRGGKAILAECRQLRDTVYPDGLPAGQAVATSAGRLNARWVIHTVGPIYRRAAVETETLRRCYRSSLQIAAELGARSLAFPLLSAGAFGWPVDDAIHQALDTIAAAPNEGTARLVLWRPEIFEAAQRIVAG